MQFSTLRKFYKCKIPYSSLSTTLQNGVKSADNFPLFESITDAEEALKKHEINTFIAILSQSSLFGLDKAECKQFVEKMDATDSSGVIKKCYNSVR